MNSKENKKGQTVENEELESPISEQIPETEDNNDETGESEFQNKLQEQNEKYLRLYSEFDNFKKRTSKERVELIKTAGVEIIVEMLPIIDDFERAIKSNENLEDVEALKEGVKLIYNKLHNALKRKGLESMETLHQEFNPDIHEAITNIPAPSDELKGKIVDELEKGYTLHGKVIRFSKVIVGN